MEDLRRLTFGRRKKRRKEEDRINQLPDELIHHILSFIDSYSVAKTCVVSKRWVNLWSTLSHLNFKTVPTIRYAKIITNFLSKRNQLCDTSKIDIDCGHKELTTTLIVDYALTHNVKHFYVCHATLDKNLSFPVLETLHLQSCSVVPLMDWSLPCLKTLHLELCTITGRRLSFEGFHKLEDLSLLNSNLEDLSLLDWDSFYDMEEMVLNAPNVIRLSITEDIAKYVIMAPKLSCFKLCSTVVPVLSAKDGFPCLKQVEFGITFPKHRWRNYNLEEKKKEVLKLITLFGEFQEIKFVTLNFGTIQVLSTFLNHIRGHPSPFVNLKCLNLRGHVLRTANPTKLTNNVIDYLVSGSTSVKIFVEEYKDSYRRFTSYNPRDDMLFSWKTGLCVVRIRENMNFKKLATSNVQGSGEVMCRGLGVILPATVHSELKGQTCSYSKDDGFSLWEGHRVYSDYVDLLKNIKRKHPETFEHFTPQSDIINTLGLNTLCSFVRALSEVSKSSFTASTITRYRGLFTDLERWGFNTTWLSNLLNDADKV